MYVFGLAFAAFLTVVPTAKSEPKTARYIVILKDSVANPDTVAEEHGRKYGAKRSHIYRFALKGYAAEIPSTAVTKIASDPRVDAITEDGQVIAAATCSYDVFNPSSQCIPPGVDRVEADLSSTASGDGSGSVNLNIAILDGGIDIDHPDLNVVGGKNCAGGKGFDANPRDFPGDYHGTFVAGVIGAKDDGIGITGVAPGAKIWAIRVLNQHGTGSISQVICGVDFVTGSRADSDPLNDIAVANMSLGGPVSEKQSDDGNCGRTKSDALHRAICGSVAAGVFYSVSAGNSGTDIKRDIPSAYDEVLTATGMADFDGEPGGRYPRALCSDWDDTSYDYSSFATLANDQTHTIAAPAACVFSTVPLDYFSPGLDGAYAISSGTSFAAPHAGGVAALCIASGACANLTPVQIIQKLRGDAEAYALAHPAEGFYGDPSDPQQGEYLGYLVRAGGY